MVAVQETGAGRQFCCCCCYCFSAGAVVQIDDQDRPVASAGTSVGLLCNRIKVDRREVAQRPWSFLWYENKWIGPQTDSSEFEQNAVALTGTENIDSARTADTGSTASWLLGLMGSKARIDFAVSAAFLHVRHRMARLCLVIAGLLHVDSSQLGPVKRNWKVLFYTKLLKGRREERNSGCGVCKWRLQNGTVVRWQGCAAGFRCVHSAVGYYIDKFGRKSKATRKDEQNKARREKEQHDKDQKF